jgi:dipeptidyl aminopeptidase/acylaminoacyl peptidase
MRFLCSCSAVALLLLAGCGSSQPLAFPDPRVPLGVHEQLVSQSSTVRLEKITFRGVKNSVVHGVLAIPRRAGRHPGVVYLHGSGGSDLDFLVWAARFAETGGVGLTISQPNDVQTFTPLVINARRALDVLAAQPEVDSHRLAVAGLSAGAETAAILAGVDKRPLAFSLMSCRGRSDVTEYLAKSRADFYVQNGLHDTVISMPELRQTISAIRGHVLVRWYDAPHTLNDAAFRSQLAWLRSELDPSR